MSTDNEIASSFAGRLNVDGLNAGRRVTLDGTFRPIGLAGPASLARSGFQFFIDDTLALVAALPDGVMPEADVRYRVSGTLEGVGEFGLFPGIVIDAVEVVADG